MLSSINNFPNNTQIAAGDQRNTSSPWGLLWLLPLELFSCREETGSPLLGIRADLPEGKAHSSPGRWTWFPAGELWSTGEKTGEDVAKKAGLGLVIAYLPLPSRGPSSSVTANLVYIAFFRLFTTTLYILFLLLEVKLLTSLAQAH